MSYRVLCGCPLHTEYECTLYHSNLHRMEPECKCWDSNENGIFLSFFQYIYLFCVGRCVCILDPVDNIKYNLQKQKRN